MHITGVHYTFHIENECARNLSFLITGVRNTSFVYHVRDRHLFLRMDEEEITDEICYDVGNTQNPHTVSLSLTHSLTLSLPRFLPLTGG